MPLPETPRRQPRWLALIEASSLVVLIRWSDWEWSFFMIYSSPIVLVAWKTS